MRKLTSLLPMLLLGLPLCAQDCLNAPIVKGSLTVSCNQITTAEVLASDVAIVAGTYPNVTLLHVKATSSDPDVIGIRIKVTFLEAANPAGGGGQFSAQASDYIKLGLVLRPPDRAPNLPMSYVFSYAYRTITSLVVEELKASSSSSF